MAIGGVYREFTVWRSVVNYLYGSLSVFIDDIGEKTVGNCRIDGNRIYINYLLIKPLASNNERYDQRSFIGTRIP